jgi:hypothetical protein
MAALPPGRANVDRTGFGRQSLGSACRAGPRDSSAAPVRQDRFSLKDRENHMNTTSPYKTIIRFEQAAEQADGPIRRIVGFVPAKNMLSLFDDATLDANPRSAKANAVVSDIIGSVRDTPEIFQFKTKGILLGTSDYAELDRKRYELHFNDPAYEGLLDGGHNMLALGIFLLSHVMDEKEIKKLKLWEDFKAAWAVNRDAVYTERDKFEFKVPVELLVPSNPEDEGVVSEFRLALIDICAARNNNAQLTTEAKANQRGFYEEIRKRMPKYLADRVEWKTNEWDGDASRPIKIRDVVALAWVPLTVLNEAGYYLPERKTVHRLTFPYSHRIFIATRASSRCSLTS